MILKKSQQNEQVANKLEQPQKLRFGRKTGNLASIETVEPEAPAEQQPVPAIKVKKRLSIDIDEQAHFNLKCHAIANRSSVATVLNELIYAHCTAKISV